MIADLTAYLDRSPSPFHAVQSAVDLLTHAGFNECLEHEVTTRAPGRYFARRAGSLVAWSTEHEPGPSRGFRVVGAHTDSPNLRIKPHPDTLSAGWQGLGVEVYGGPLLTSWLDRDLGLSGRVVLRAGSGTTTRLFAIDEPLLRISALAIHLNRELHTEGLKLNPQRHLVPHWGLGERPGDFHGFLAEHLQVPVPDVLAWEAMTHDLTPARVIGRDSDLVAAARLDNLATCHAAVRALLAMCDHSLVTPSAPSPLIVLFDHEEVGSTSASGAQSTFLPGWLERIVTTRGGGREDYLRSMANTIIASADMTHATHPNYPEKHDALHPVRMNGGPVLKVNAQERYATDSLGAAAFMLACEQAGVPMQTFVNRTDLPCGSTVGPVTAAATGATVVDVGAATLSMHSAREVCGVADHAAYIAALSAFLGPVA